jgi:hypothetical protein
MYNYIQRKILYWKFIKKRKEWVKANPDAQLYDYASLIEKFLNREISVKEFERTYLDVYLADEVPISEELFDTLDWLFAEVDAYTDLPLEPDDDPADHLNEDQLRKSAAKTLAELEEFKAQNKLP